MSFFELGFWPPLIKQSVKVRPTNFAKVSQPVFRQDCNYNI